MILKLTLIFILALCVSALKLKGRVSSLIEQDPLDSLVENEETAFAQMEAEQDTEDFDLGLAEAEGKCYGSKSLAKKKCGSGNYRKKYAKYCCK